MANGHSLLAVWSKSSTSLAVSKKLKFFNGDEFIEGTGPKKVTPRSPKKTARLLGDRRVNLLSFLKKGLGLHYSSLVLSLQNS